MRSFEEIGRFTHCGDGVNDAYQTYASLYLDCCDDNLKHFLGRDMDTRPLDAYEEENKEEELSEETIERLFLDAAVDIVQHTVCKEFPAEYFLREYPLLESRREEIVAL